MSYASISRRLAQITDEIRTAGDADFPYYYNNQLDSSGMNVTTGTIHKDIKPANIPVDLESGGVWLTGFGIASRLPRRGSDIRQNSRYA